MVSTKFAVRVASAVAAVAFMAGFGVARLTQSTPEERIALARIAQEQERAEMAMFMRIAPFVASFN